LAIEENRYKNKEFLGSMSGMIILHPEEPGEHLLPSKFVPVWYQMLLLLLFRNSTASCDDMCNSVN
jgi:hypothetical protein